MGFEKRALKAFNDALKNSPEMFNGIQPSLVKIAQGEKVKAADKAFEIDREWLEEHEPGRYDELKIKAGKTADKEEKKRKKEAKKQQQAMDASALQQPPEPEPAQVPQQPSDDQEEEDIQDIQRQPRGIEESFFFTGGLVL